LEWRETTFKGTRTGFKVLWELAKVIVPTVMIVHLLEKTGMLQHISRFLGPLMELFGVPGEGALALVIANLGTVYGGLAALVALDLTVKEITILAAMMMVCHGAISETALVVKAGARGSWVLGARLAAMVLVGMLLRIILP
jgi:hypothetical protein